MITLSFALLCAAAVLGGVLGVLFLRGAKRKPIPHAFALFHGALGASSLATLLAALHLGPPPSRMGTESFGRIAAALLALAFFLGLLFLWGTLRGKRPAETLVGLHAGLAIAAFAVLLALLVLT